MVELHVFHKNLIIFSFDWSVCQQWRQLELSRKFWGTKLKTSSFSIFIPWSVYNSVISFKPSITRPYQFKWYRGNFDVFPARCSLLICLLHHLLKSLPQVQWLKQNFVINHNDPGELFRTKRSNKRQHSGNSQIHSIVGEVAQKIITIFSIASPQPKLVTIESDSNEPIVHYGYGMQQPIIPGQRLEFDREPF